MKQAAAQWLAALIILAAAFAISASLFQDETADRSLTQRIDLSISDTHLEMPVFARPTDDDPLPKLASRYNLVRDTEEICERFQICGWIDPDGVNHRLIVQSGRIESTKSFELDGSEAALPALGIGINRGQTDVLQAIKAWAPKLTFYCEAIGREHVQTDCTSRFGENYLSLEFNVENRLGFIYWSGEHRHWADLPGWILIAGWLILVPAWLALIYYWPTSGALPPWTQSIAKKSALLGLGSSIVLSAIDAASSLISLSTRSFNPAFNVFTISLIVLISVRETLFGPISQSAILP